MVREAFSQIGSDLRPSRLFANLIAGVVVSSMVLLVEISFAALIFSGDLAPFVSNGIGLMLFGAFVIGLLILLTSAFRNVIAVPQETPVAILALVGVGIAASMPAGASPGALYFTMAAAIVLTSLLMALTFWLVGRFKLGALVRFIPYPVFGGFLAGTGWLLFEGGLVMMSGVQFEFAHISEFFALGSLVKWLPGLLFGVLLVLVVRRTGKFQNMLYLLLGGLALFYIALFASGSSIAEASARGWLLGPFPEGSLYRPLTPASLGLVYWPAIFGQLGKILSILVIGLIAFLLNATGMELLFHQTEDLNHELESVGAANLVAGLGGSSPGYHAVSMATLGHALGAGRLAGLVSVSVIGVVFFFGASFLSLLPKVVLGGLLIFLGLHFLVEWLYDAWFTLPRSEYALVVVILAIVAGVGFLEGVAVGVVMAVVLFVVNYSRVDVVKVALSGVDFQSNVDRAVQHRRILDSVGDRIYILKLDGYLFFGTANSLFERVRARVTDPALPPVRFVILDFDRVIRLDSSAMNSFTKIKQLAEAENFKLLFTDLPAQLCAHLVSAGFALENDEWLRIFPDLDHGVEWCEDQLLQESGAEPELRLALPEMFQQAFSDEVDFGHLMPYLERDEFPAGHVLIEQDTPVDGLYFIESGAVNVVLEDEHGDRIRLRTMGAGTVVGELGFYLGYPATAHVVAAKPATVFRMSKESLRRIETEKPEVAAAFHKLITLFLGERLAHTNKTLRALMD